MENKDVKIPMMNQVFRDAARMHLEECGLPPCLMYGVDCSSYENMEQTLTAVKESFYSAVRRQLDGTDRPNPLFINEYMNYTPKDDWADIFAKRDYAPENNKYIADLHSIMSDYVQIGTYGRKLKKLLKEETQITKELETELPDEYTEKLERYIDLEGEINYWSEKESFICGFRTAYHLLSECY